MCNIQATTITNVASTSTFTAASSVAPFSWCGRSPLVTLSALPPAEAAWLFTSTIPRADRQTAIQPFSLPASQPVSHEAKVSEHDVSAKIVSIRLSVYKASLDCFPIAHLTLCPLTLSSCQCTC